MTATLGPVRAAIPTRRVTPDRSRNRWPWVVGGAFAGLAVHSSFDWGHSRVLAVAGCVVGFLIAMRLERALMTRASREHGPGRKTLVLTDSELAIVMGRVSGGRAVETLDAAPVGDISSILVENVGRRWKRALGFGVVAVVFVSEFVVIHQDYILLGAIFAAVIVAFTGVSTTSDVWVRLSDGHQWKFNVPASEWLDFYPLIPGLKWRGSGDGTRLDDDTDTWSLIGYPNR